MSSVKICPKTTVGWPPRDTEAIVRIAGSGEGLVDLWEASPVRIQNNETNTEEIIDALFPNNPLLCCGWGRHRFDTRPRHRWFKLCDLQFIVPNPMTAKQGMTKRGVLSAHSLGNTGVRRFVVVEFDFKDTSSGEANLFANGRDESDLCASLLLHLGELAPLALVVHSGRKSLHGWFHCHGIPEERVGRFFKYAVSLGADTATWSRCQFVRMPDGMRDNGRRQTVFFFNPAVIK